MINPVSNGTPESDGFVDLFHKISDRIENQEKEWVKALRESGIKGAHPDDGWVNRKENQVMFVYPQFNDGIKIGDRIALGDARKHRVVRIIEVIDLKLRLSKSKTYKFEAE